jgi:hypothetical protein
MLLYTVTVAVWLTLTAISLVSCLEPTLRVVAAYGKLAFPQPSRKDDSSNPSKTAASRRPSRNPLLARVLYVNNGRLFTAWYGFAVCLNAMLLYSLYVSVRSCIATLCRL